MNNTKVKAKKMYLMGKKCVWKVGNNSYILTSVDKDNCTSAYWCDPRGHVTDTKPLGLVYRKSAHKQCMQRLGYQLIS